MMVVVVAVEVVELVVKEWMMVKKVIKVEGGLWDFEESDTGTVSLKPAP